MPSASPPLSASPAWPNSRSSSSWPAPLIRARGSSAVRWGRDYAVAEVLHHGPFDEDDLYAALDELCTRQETIENTLYQRYL